jgi:capsular polysaccharide biosynthesis protein
MKLRRYFNIIKRWWWLLIVGMIIPMGISYYFVSRQPALYQAKVTLLVGRVMPQQAIPHQEPWKPGVRLAQAYTVLVKRRPITEAVIRKLGLERSPDELAKQITAWISPEAQLLEIMVTDTNPQAAALIANALADELIRQNPDSDNVLRVVEPAFEPTGPVSSRSNVIPVVAGATGLVLAAVFVILAECLASRVQDRGAGLRSKTGLFKRERLGRISAATPDKPYTITVKLYDGDELWASGEIRFHVADAPSCGGGSEEPDECDGPCPVRE